MSVDVFVQRGAGLKRGADIESPLITQTGVALELGVNLLDSHASATSDTIKAIYRKGVKPGQLIEVHDALQGESWRGKITGYSLTKQSVGDGLELTLRVRRPT